MGREICFLKKKLCNEILLVHHDCNPNDQENLYKLQIETASSKKKEWELPSWNTTQSELILFSSMWAKHKKSEIQIGKRNPTRQVPTTAFIDGKDISFLKYKMYSKILPGQYVCNQNDRKNSHTLQIETAFS